MASLTILGGISLAIGLIILAAVLRFAQKNKSFFIDKRKKKSDKNNNNKSNSSAAASNAPNNKVTLDPEADAKYILNKIRPNSSPLDVLYIIATSPDNIAVATKSLEIRDNLVSRKLAHIADLQRKKAAAEASSASATLDELLNDDNDDGWADDDDTDEKVLAAKKAKEEKVKQDEALARATGKDQDDVSKLMLEGVDEHVLGSDWVKGQLTTLGLWPPPGFNASNGKRNGFDSATQRNLLMTMGRLNARQLNNHPELIKAGPLGNIDPTYFQSTMEYRNRVGQQLDNVLRFACTLRCFRLVNTVLDAIVMFKIGLMDVATESSKKDNEWFHEMMVKQYGRDGTPRLILEEKYLGVPTAEPETAEGNNKTDAEKKEEEKNKLVQLIQQARQVTTTDEKMSLEMQITRAHAEAFTREKLAVCQRQGIPPQIALQAYREAWFIIVRAYKLNDDGSRMTNWEGITPNHFALMKENKHPICDMMDDETTASFEKEFDLSGGGGKNDVCDRKLIVGWPFIISNVAQKTGKVKIHLPPPELPGKYEFVVTIKSQEFLCDCEEFKITVDVAQGLKKEVKEEDGAQDKENKKDK